MSTCTMFEAKVWDLHIPEMGKSHEGGYFLCAYPGCVVNVRWVGNRGNAVTSFTTNTIDAIGEISTLNKRMDVTMRAARNGGIEQYIRLVIEATVAAHEHAFPGCSEGYKGIH